jgi:hypothetical protein
MENHTHSESSAEEIIDIPDTDIVEKKEEIGNCISNNNDDLSSSSDSIEIKTSSILRNKKENNTETTKSKKSISFSQDSIPPKKEPFVPPKIYVPPHKQFTESNYTSKTPTSLATDRFVRARPMRIPLPETLVNDPHNPNYIPNTPNAQLHKTLIPLIDELYTKTATMAKKAKQKAEIYKMVYVCVKIFNTIAGVVIGVLNIGNISNSVAAQYTSMTLGFVISAIQSLLALFPIDRRGVLLKEDANKLKTISRHVKLLKSMNMSTLEKLKKLEDFYAEVDNIDMDIYDFVATTGINFYPGSTENLIDQLTSQQ